MVADYRAATPSNAAQILVPDRREVSSHVRHRLKSALQQIDTVHLQSLQQLTTGRQSVAESLSRRLEGSQERLRALKRTISQLNPKTVLGRGYAIARLSSGQLVDETAARGQELSIEIKNAIIIAGVTNVKKNH